MKIEKLLFVTKFEQLGFDALSTMLNLREAALNHIVFVYVIERDRVAMRRGTGYRKDEERRLREIANIRFIDWAEDLFEQGMEVGVYIVVGGMVGEVIKATQKEEADLIVIGRSHKGVIEQLYAGSDVIELLRRSATPVLVYKHMPDQVIVIDKPFSRPLLAMDWSPASMRAVAYLKALGNVLDEIHVVHVVDDKQIKGDNAMAIQKTRKETRRKLDDICDDFLQHGIKAEPHVYVGDPDKQIDTAARDCQATLIVMGSSAKSAWAERWLGSTPRAIAEESVFSTLLVPPQQT